MGIFGGIGKVLGGIGKGIGSVLKTAAPIASFIPGIGPIIGAGAGVLGNILSPSQQQAAQTPGGAAPIPGQGGGGFGRQVGNAAAILNAGLQQQKSTNLADEAIQFARTRTEETSPLRLAAIESLQRPIPQGPDLSHVFSDPSNPFNRVKRTAAPIGAGG